MSNGQAVHTQNNSEHFEATIPQFSTINEMYFMLLRLQADKPE